MSGDTLSKGLIEIKPNVKYKQVLKRLATNDILKNAGCDFDPTSTVTLTERILEPEYFKVNLQLCKEDFRSDWEAESMGYSAHDELPKTFADYMISYVAAKVAAKMETNIWAGATANNGEFDGFEVLLASNADQPASQEVAGTTLDASNIVAELGKVVDEIPNALFKDDLCIFIPISAYRLYLRAQAALGFIDRFNNQDMGDVMFDGVKLVVCPGMSDNTMICTTKDNLYFGTGLVSDHNQVKVIDMEDIDGSDNVRFIMKMSAAVQYANGEDIVTYGITNSAN
ncbi:hypothetical protein D8Z79_025810 (plasmid) [Escherichia fergusonii]|uniref:Phage major capsid protein n=3 Tax=Lysinibacillus pakistanensis TaxID=759811 RepID=A0ABX6DGV9_9BACI|nr:hypothetical protein [Escherichia fergusonii]QCZ35060.1 hypothetical protein D8Z79_025810 [Escherichia fergusonii]QGG54066.1 hypothetical protein GDS87_24410 [Lysinibacillus pakistanensis]